MLYIGIVAGEASGDYLGAELIRVLKERYGDILVEGVGGKKMQSQGCRSIFPMEKLAVMGIVEVLGSYIQLWGIRRKLISHFRNTCPDIFIGIDAPDFNLGLEQSLRTKGVPTIHYVSPSVWAWRKHRLGKIASAVDLVLTLFPFEPEIYRQHNIPAKFVGHPLAKNISMQGDKISARKRLGLDSQSRVIAIMPGSRDSELKRLLPPFLGTAELCLKNSVKLQFISSVLDLNSLRYFEQVQKKLSLDHLPLNIFCDRTHDVLEAADVVLLASGTVALEAMLFKKPMVVGYRVNPLTYLLIKSLVYVEHVSLPNLLAGRELVPECLQGECEPENLHRQLQYWLDNPQQVARLENEFSRIHQELLTGGVNAADAVQELIESKQAENNAN